MTTDTTWTCPRCNGTVVIYASPAMTAHLIRVAQEWHAAEHLAAAKVAARIGRAA